MAEIARRTGWASLGLDPCSSPTRIGYRPRTHSASTRERPAKPGARLRIAVPILPRISNFDDLDPLDAEPSVEVIRGEAGKRPARRRAARHPARLEERPSLISPRCGPTAGTSTSPPMRGAAATCWASAAATRCWGAPSPTRMASRACRRHRARARPARCGDRALRREAPRRGERGDDGRHRLRGLRDAYGRHRGPGRARPFCRIDGAPEGAVPPDGRVIGTYAHGLFADDRQRTAWLRTARRRPRAHGL